MGLWSAAQNTVDMASASLRAWQIIETLTRCGKPREALAVARIVVLTMLEGYQGKVRGAVLNVALTKLAFELDAEGAPTEGMIDRFSAALT